ncbi:MAG TPA: hypothetical protein VHB98_01270 [Chloroflexota bacterium]|nr:hypothetical protein [Chloroflexota bacterium]
MPVLLIALLVLPIIAIILVILNTVQPPRAAPSSRAGTPPARSVAPVVNPCCVHWQHTSLTSETDALLADPRQPGTIIAGTTTGIWISPDGGRTWQPDRTGPSNVSFLSLAGVKASAALFAGAADGRIFMRGAQRGDHWQPISPPLAGGEPIFSLAVSSDDQVLLAGTVGALYRGALHAGHWQWQLVAHTGDSSVPAIVWAPWDARQAFAGVFGTRPAMLRTTDGGHT